MHVVCCQAHLSEVRDLLDEALDCASYPVRDVETLSESGDQIELAAVLVPSTASEAELDAVVRVLEASPHVRSATWSVETTA